MNKEDFVAYYAEKNGTSKVEAAKNIKAYEKAFKAAILDGYTPAIVGVLTTKITKGVKAEVRNPKTNEVIATNQPFVRVSAKMSPTLKKAVKDAQ